MPGGQVVSAAPSETPERSKFLRRRVPRHLVVIPVDITFMRPEGPGSVAGRLRNVSEGGIQVALPEQLRPGQPVTVEFRLPGVTSPIRADAVVRHQADQQCGIEFLGLTAQQRELIHQWVGRRQMSVVSEPDIPSPEATTKETPADEISSDQKIDDPRKIEEAIEVGASPSPRKRRRWVGTVVVVLLLALACGAAWRYWQYQWKQLEAPVSAGSITAPARKRVRVSAETMQQLLTHKVEPVYPEALRPMNVQGTVVLDATIGPDGSVLEVHPISGPEALVPAAVEAVKWWRFEPYRVNGEPVEVATTFAVEFHP